MNEKVFLNSILFTFHYVSIKSQTLDNPVRGRYDLHSTMYLLNLTH